MKKSIKERIALAAIGLILIFGICNISSIIEFFKNL